MTVDLGESDTRPNYEYTITDDEGNAVDVSSATSIQFMMQKQGADTLTVDDDDDGNVSLIGDGTDGKVQYDWQDGDTDDPGNYEAQWRVTFSNGEKQRYPRDEFVGVEIHAGL